MVRTLDAAGYLERQEFPGDIGKPKMFGGDLRGHCLNRPVAVRGAAPGDMLKVEIVSLTPDAWGWTSSPGAAGSPVPGRLGLAEADPAWLLWEIDAAGGTATANGKYTRSLAPFLGVTGVAPPSRRALDDPAAYRSGGNIDCKESSRARSLPAGEYRGRAALLRRRARRAGRRRAVRHRDRVRHDDRGGGVARPRPPVDPVHAETPAPW